MGPPLVPSVPGGQEPGWDWDWSHSLVEHLGIVWSVVPRKEEDERAWGPSPRGLVGHRCSNGSGSCFPPSPAPLPGQVTPFFSGTGKENLGA
jgi:hypothetical protein